MITTSGLVFGPDITNPSYSASKAALQSLTQTIRLQFERDGSPVRVVEFLAPLVDSPFAAGVPSDSKMAVENAVDLMLRALKTDDVELRVGAAEDIYQALARAMPRSTSSTTPLAVEHGPHHEYLIDPKEKSLQ